MIAYAALGRTMQPFFAASTDQPARSGGKPGQIGGLVRF